MSTELPYMPSVTNLVKILTNIRSAGTPPKFTHDFLKSNLGFSSSNDRAVIRALRSLGFLAVDGTPTARYNEFRGPNSGVALAAGLREGWAASFLSDQKIYERSSSEIHGVSKNVTGAGESAAKKMASTFKTLAGEAN